MEGLLVKHHEFTSGVFLQNKPSSSLRDGLF